jgi:hypothetical protein
VYANRRWTNSSSTLTDKDHGTLCGLQRLRFALPASSNAAGEPRGFVFLDGDFFSSHGEEIEQLLRNEAKRAAADNPLARTMEFKRGDGHRLTVTTTTEHLAQRLGHALEKAFGGSVHYDFA